MSLHSRSAKKRKKSLKLIEAKIRHFFPLFYKNEVHKFPGDACLKIFFLIWDSHWSPLNWDDSMMSSMRHAVYSHTVKIHSQISWQTAVSSASQSFRHWPGIRFQTQRNTAVHFAYVSVLLPCDNSSETSSYSWQGRLKSLQWKTPECSVVFGQTFLKNCSVLYHFIYAGLYIMSKALIGYTRWDYTVTSAGVAVCVHVIYH